MVGLDCTVVEWIFLFCSMCFYIFFFFFSSRRRHTRLTCDWSSDVCSSDLDEGHLHDLAVSAQHEPGIGKLKAAYKHLFRSEERRVGKECRSRWAPDH